MMPLFIKVPKQDLPQQPAMFLLLFFAPAPGRVLRGPTQTPSFQRDEEGTTLIIHFLKEEAKDKKFAWGCRI